jgi:methionyl-tRNA synthetase
MATGLPLPEHLLVHGWLLVDNKKMSKSLGNAIDPHELATTYGVDPVRYYLVRHLATNQDANFSIKELEQRVSSDLANDLGNLLNRMTALAEKNSITTLVAPATWSKDAVALRDASHAMVSEFCTIMEREIAFHKALAVLWKYINQVNAFFQTREPWKQAKNDHAAFLETLSATVHSLETIATLLLPVMPSKMAALLASIGVEKTAGDRVAQLKNTPWNTTYTMTKIEPLFEKPIERETPVETKDTKPTELVKTEPTNVAQISVAPTNVVDAPAIPEITIDEFIKVHCVVGTIEHAVEVDGSDKLLKLTVNMGSYGTRTILSGVKKFFAPADLIGKQGVFVANLKPRKMMGQESHGMMLFVESADGSLRRISVDGVIENGARLR